jgi:hypothetical protein
VFHEPCLKGKCSSNQVPAVDYFYSAAALRLRDALWPIFAPALIDIPDAGNVGRYAQIGNTTYCTLDSKCEAVCIGAAQQRTLMAI